MMPILLSIWAWMKDNPVFVWGVVSAVASALYTKLEAYPRTHAVLSFMAGWGIDLPAILDALRRLLGGLPPVGSNGGKSPPPTPPAPPAPPQVGSPPPPVEPPAAATKMQIFDRWWNAVGFASAILVLVTLSMNNCAWFQKNGAQTAIDVIAIAACVVSKEETGEDDGQIAVDCGLQNAQAVVNLISTMDKRAVQRFECTRAGRLNYRMHRDGGDPL